MDELLLGLLVLGVVLIVPVLGVAGFVRAGRLRREIAALTARVAALELQLAASPALAASPEAAAAAPAPAEITPAEAPPVDVVAPPPAEPVTADAAAAREAPAAPAEAPAPRFPEPPKPTLEERIASRWAVWLGGGTIALAAVFLVRYSIEEGLLGPGARVVLGLLLGFALLAASEWMRRGRVAEAAAHGAGGRLGAAPANLPPAVAAAGLIALYAAIFAAFALYEMIGPPVAFAGLAVVSAAAMALSLLHGPMVALLGQAAAFAVPALAGGRGGGALPLFAYVLAVAGGCLALARYRGWRWTMWVALAGAMGWLALWVLLRWQPSDSPWLAIFLVALAAMHLAPALGPPEDAAVRREPLLSRDLMPDVPVIAVALAAFALARMADYDTPSVAALLGVFAIAVVMARRTQRLDLLPLPMAAIAIAAIASWHIPRLVETGLTGVELHRGDVLAPEAWRFLAAAGVFGAAGLAAGGVSLGGALRPWRWAALATVMPLALFAVAYWRTEAFEASFGWGLAALALAGVYAVAAERVARWREAEGMALALGILAIGVTTAVSFCFATTLRAGWLSIALSLQIPALAWISERLGVRELRWAAALVAAALVVRLVLNPWVVGYPLGETPVFNAILWIYGIPALACGFGAIRFARTGRDWSVELLEVAAIAFATMLVSAEIRHGQGGGRLDGDVGGLLECALHAAAWLAIGLALHARAPAIGSRVAAAGAWVLAALGTLAAVLGSLLAANPLDSGEAVGRFPLLNTLGLAYLVPAALYAGYARVALGRGAQRLAAASGIAALVFGFIYLSLEVTRAFRGSVLTVARGGDGELYAYSAVWLLYGIGLMVAGLRYGVAALRYAALGVVGVTILKVFLFDMAELTGILRVLSFLGLGLSLLGLAWVYQRFVMRRAAA